MSIKMFDRSKYIYIGKSLGTPMENGSQSLIYDPSHHQRNHDAAQIGLGKAKA